MMARFKEGDVVVHTRNGQKGNVVLVEPGMHGMMVVSFPHWHGSLGPQEIRYTHRTPLIKHYNQRVAENTRERQSFRVGQKVKNRVSLIGIVKEIDNSGVRVRWNDHTAGETFYSHSSARFGLTILEEPPVFRHGDKVTHNQAPWLGTGTVIDTHYYTKVSWWNENGSRNYLYPALCLTKVDNQQENTMNCNTGLKVDRGTEYFDLNSVKNIRHFSNPPFRAYAVLALDGWGNGPKRGYPNAGAARRVAEEMAKKHGKPFTWVRIEGIVNPPSEVQIENF